MLELPITRIKWSKELIYNTSFEWVEHILPLTLSFKSFDVIK